MEKYDYRKAVENDVREYLAECGETTRLGDDGLDKMYEEMFVSDSVTGNGSGSYTFSRWEAEENLCHNTDLLEVVADEYGMDAVKVFDPEACDVQIRCHLLRGVLEAVNESLPEEGDGEEDDED